MSYTVKLSNRSEKEYKNLEEKSHENENIKLLVKIMDSFDALESDEKFRLDIKTITREKKRPIYEIRIKTPVNYRIFYSIKKETKEIWVLDMKEKKVPKFSAEYFKGLFRLQKSYLGIFYNYFF